MSYSSKGPMRNRSSTYSPNFNRRNLSNTIAATTQRNRNGNFSFSKEELLRILKGEQSDRSHLIDSKTSLRYDKRRTRQISFPSVNITTNYYQLDLSFPSQIHQYCLKVFCVDQNDKINDVDICSRMETELLSALLLSLFDKYENWNIGKGVDITFDGKSIIYSSGLLPFVGKLKEILRPINRSNSNNFNKKFAIELIRTDEITIPLDLANLDQRVLTALNSSVFAFFRNNNDNTKWLKIGSSTFNIEEKIPLNDIYCLYHGYYANLASCLSGLVLNIDIVSMCFFNGVDMITLMCGVTNLKIEDLLSKGLNNQQIKLLNKIISNVKIVTKHLNSYKRKLVCKELGPPANSAESKFRYGNKTVTVEQYYAIMATNNPENYKKLNYPQLPCVRTANKSLIPAELVRIASVHQRKTNIKDPYVARKFMDNSAVIPNKRMNLISSIIKSQDNFVKKEFGIKNISSIPINVNGIILPNALLQYDNNVVDPLQDGKWKSTNQIFTSSDKLSCHYKYSMLVIEKHNNWQNLIDKFQEDIKCNSLSHQLKLERIKTHFCNFDKNEINLKINSIVNEDKVNIVIIVFPERCNNIHSDYKLIFSKLTMPVQFIKWENIEKSRAFMDNFMNQLASKLGVTTYTLACRNPNSNISLHKDKIYQSPAYSNIWLFNKPCMVVGIDVSHPESGSRKDSIVAITASMDCSLNQYGCFICPQRSRMEIIATAIEEGMVELFTEFKRLNQIMPSYLVLYRDGVSESQYDQVIENEISQIKSAIHLMGYLEDSVKIIVIICQKNHHTRLLLKDNENFLNPQPGLFVYSSDINSSTYNEFYLVSHHSSLGTTKPCKYTIIFDEIGMYYDEIGIMTYWICYLYARSNSSVSYATPAYYAHWASKFGMEMSIAGATKQDFVEISRKFLSVYPMFFI